MVSICRSRFGLGLMILLGAGLLQPLLGQAQIARELTFASSPNPVGSGARALGRGGAFIAMADDATAASWNPAGLANLEFPEVSGVVSFLSRNESVDFGAGAVRSEDFNTNTLDLNYLSAVYPTEALPVYLVFSFNYQLLYTFNRSVGYHFSGPRTADVMSLNSSGRVQYDQAGALSALSPACAVEITHRFSLGATLNYWNSAASPNGWDQRFRYWEAGDLTLGSNTYPFSAHSDIQERYRLTGDNLNFHLGLLWDINDHWRLGAVYKSELVAKVKHQRQFFSGQYFPTFSGWTSVTAAEQTFRETLHLPPVYGLGVAFQPSDRWSFDLDVSRTEWNRYILEDEKGHRFNLIKGRIGGHADVQPTHQARLGMEYLYIKNRTVFPIRAGVFYDPEPNVGQPQNVWGASLGGGYAKGKILLDAAYQLRWGQNLESEVVADQKSQRDLLESVFLVSMIVHLKKG